MGVERFGVMNSRFRLHFSFWGVALCFLISAPFPTPRPKGTSTLVDRWMW